jgi:hypothetical protein
MAYLEGTNAVQLPGEIMSKRPISIRPVDPSTKLDQASRINFREVFPVQFNVKVKEIGMVTWNFLQALRRDWLQVQEEEEEGEEEEGEEEEGEEEEGEEEEGEEEEDEDETEDWIVSA